MKEGMNAFMIKKNCKHKLLRYSYLLLVFFCMWHLVGCSDCQDSPDYLTALIHAVCNNEPQTYCELTGAGEQDVYALHQIWTENLAGYLMYQNQVDAASCPSDLIEEYYRLANLISEKIMFEKPVLIKETKDSMHYRIEFWPLDLLSESEPECEELLMQYIGQNRLSENSDVQQEILYGEAVLQRIKECADNSGYEAKRSIEVEIRANNGMWSLSEEQWEKINNALLGIRQD